MYCTDEMTGDTRFEVAGATATEVVLEGFNERGSISVAMKRERSRWSARLALPKGWFFYRFRIDGQPHWDRDVGKLSAENGGRYSLAVINCC